MNRVVMARMRAKPGRADEVERVTAILVAATRSEEGCLTYDPHRGQDDPDVFVMYEVWASWAHLEATSGHRTSQQSPRSCCCPCPLGA